MAMVQMTPTTAVREDMVDQYEICPRCDGKPWRAPVIAAGPGWWIRQHVYICSCEGGVRRKRKE